MEHNDATVAIRASLRAGPDAVAEAIDLARRFVARAPCGADAEAKLCILIEELVANIVEHGAPPPDSAIMLAIDAIGAEIGITISDAGQAFDPRLAEDTADLPPERGGGAGLALLRHWASVIDYARVDGRNELRLVLPSHG